MTPVLKGMLTVAAVLAAAGVGLWAGQAGLVKLPFHTSALMIDVAKPDHQGPVIYYREPNGKPL
jgi:Cu(I)/Ag(I) efflux system membrane fusion protein